MKKYLIVTGIFIITLGVTIVAFISIRTGEETVLSAISSAGVMIAIWTAMYLNKITEINIKKQSEAEAIENRTLAIKAFITELIHMKTMANIWQSEIEESTDPKGFFTARLFNQPRPFYQFVLSNLKIFEPKIMAIIALNEIIYYEKVMALEWLKSSEYCDPQKAINLCKTMEINLNTYTESLCRVIGVTQDGFEMDIYT